MKIRNPKTGNLHVAHPRRGQSLARRRDRPLLDHGLSSDREYWQKWFPADFITEMLPRPVPQLVLRPAGHEHHDGAEGLPFKVLLGHALVRDEKGEEMHKSKGNSDSFRGRRRADERRPGALDVLPAQCSQ